MSEFNPEESQPQSPQPQHSHPQQAPTAPPRPSQPEESKSKRTLTILAILLILLAAIACGAFIYWQLTRAFPQPPERVPVATPSPPPTIPPPPDIELPLIEESDEFVRSALQELSDHPRFAAWVLPDRLITRFVTAVDNISRGRSPRVHLGFLKPGAEFRSREQDGELVIDPATFARYDRFTEVFVSLDTKTGVRLYQQFKPLFQEAYEKLGFPGEDFDDALAKACDHLLATPIPQGPVAIHKRITGFGYRDPQLEDLSPAQKHYLRLGPENARQVHAKLRLMQTALGLTEAQRQTP